MSARSVLFSFNLRFLMNQQTNPVRFLRTTAIGGLLFLLPLIVVGALVGRELLKGCFRRYDLFKLRGGYLGDALALVEAGGMAPQRLIQAFELGGGGRDPILSAVLIEELQLARAPIDAMAVTVVVE